MPLSRSKPLKNHSSNQRRKAIDRVKKKAQLYARLRDCGGRSGSAPCISCTRDYPFTDFDGGHFIAATSSAIMFDERNINAQCRKCNRFMHGNQRHYLRGMIRKYGEEVVAELESQEFTMKKWTLGELLELELYFNSKISEYN